MSRMYNFGLDPEQLELKASLRKYLDGECSLAKTRKIIETPTRFAGAEWRELASLGFAGISIPETFGGSGLGPCHLVAAMEEAGRCILPAPYLETVAVAELISQAGSESQKRGWLPDIVKGDCVATFAIDEPEGAWDASAIRASAMQSGDGYVLKGTKMWVPFAHVADLIVCAVGIEAGTEATDDIGLVALSARKLGARVRVLDTVDDCYPLCELTLDGLIVSAADFIGPIGGGWESWGHARRIATVLASAQLVGGMDRSLEMLVSFSKERMQFGKPIGSYQAMKHRCADLLADLEVVRGSVYYAAWSLQERSADMDIAVASAKAASSDAAVRSAEKALQSFGAIGFTWEHDIHFYLKRAKRLELTLGDATFHREQLASYLL